MCGLMAVATSRPSTTHSGPAGDGVHRAGRAGLFRLAGGAQRAGRVSGDGAQHPRAARGAGLRQSAAHFGRASADGLGLSRVRGPALRARTRSRHLPDVEALRPPGTVGDLLEQASQELSRASHQVGFALAPAGTSVRLRHVDFVDLDGGRVLVVVVAAGGQITHKLVEPAERCDSTFDAGRQLRQHRVCRAHASRSAGGHPRAAAAGAIAL